MKECIFLIDPNTGKYFTNNDNRYWSRDLEDAYPYDIYDNMAEIVRSIIINNVLSSDILENVSYIIPQRVFIINK